MGPHKEFNGNRYYKDGQGYWRRTNGSRDPGGAKMHHEVWEFYHGSFDRKTHIVHHKNRNKDDNSIENFELLGRKDHEKEHRQDKAGRIQKVQNAWRSTSFRKASRIDDIAVHCEICGRLFIKDKYIKTVTCSRKCQDKRCSETHLAKNQS